MGTGHRILMVDDDTALMALLKDYFEKYGHVLKTATTGEAGLAELRRERPDIMILDLMLPGKDGLTVCREVRSESDVPIVMLTARGDVSDRIVGLEFGADDYMAKPFEPRELIARIDSVLRRSQIRGPQDVHTSDGLHLDKGSRRVTLNDAEVDLTSTEFELLQILMESSGRVLSRDQLLQKLRGADAEVYDRSVDMLVSRLRQKLKDDVHAPRFIKTVWRTGYQFVSKPDGC